MKTEILSFAAKCMDLKDELNEAIQSSQEKEIC